MSQEVQQKKYKGAYKSGKKYKAQLQYGGNNYYLGTYDTAIEAAKAYDVQLRILHSDTNNPNYSHFKGCTPNFNEDGSEHISQVAVAKLNEMKQFRVEYGGYALVEGPGQSGSEQPVRLQSMNPLGSSDALRYLPDSAGGVTCAQAVQLPICDPSQIYYQGGSRFRAPGTVLQDSRSSDVMVSGNEQHQQRQLPSHVLQPNNPSGFTDYRGVGAISTNNNSNNGSLNFNNSFNLDHSCNHKNNKEWSRTETGGSKSVDLVGGVSRIILPSLPPLPRMYLIPSDAPKATVTTKGTLSTSALALVGVVSTPTTAALDTQSQLSLSPEHHHDRRPNRNVAIPTQCSQVVRHMDSSRNNNSDSNSGVKLGLETLLTQVNDQIALGESVLNRIKMLQLEGGGPGAVDDSEDRDRPTRAHAMDNLFDLQEALNVEMKKLYEEKAKTEWRLAQGHTKQQKNDNQCHIMPACGQRSFVGEGVVYHNTSDSVEDNDTDRQEVEHIGTGTVTIPPNSSLSISTASNTSLIAKAARMVDLVAPSVGGMGHVAPDSMPSPIVGEAPSSPSGSPPLMSTYEGSVKGGRMGKNYSNALKGFGVEVHNNSQNTSYSYDDNSNLNTSADISNNSTFISKLANTNISSSFVEGDPSGISSNSQDNSSIQAHPPTFGSEAWVLQQQEKERKQKQQQKQELATAQRLKKEAAAAARKARQLDANYLEDQMIQQASAQIRWKQKNAAMLCAYPDCQPSTLEPSPYPHYQQQPRQYYHNQQRKRRQQQNQQQSFDWNRHSHNHNQSDHAHHEVYNRSSDEMYYDTTRPQYQYQDCLSHDYSHSSIPLHSPISSSSSSPLPSQWSRRCMGTGACEEASCMGYGLEEEDVSDMSDIILSTHQSGNLSVNQSMRSPESICGGEEEEEGGDGEDQVPGGCDRYAGMDATADSQRSRSSPSPPHTTMNHRDGDADDSHGDGNVDKSSPSVAVSDPLHEFIPPDTGTYTAKYGKLARKRIRYINCNPKKKQLLVEGNGGVYIGRGDVYTAAALSTNNMMEYSGGTGREWYGERHRQCTDDNSSAGGGVVEVGQYMSDSAVSDSGYQVRYGSHQSDNNNSRGNGGDDASGSQPVTSDAEWYRRRQTIQKQMQQQSTDQCTCVDANGSSDRTTVSTPHRQNTSTVSITAAMLGPMCETPVALSPGIDTLRYISGVMEAVSPSSPSSVYSDYSDMLTAAHGESDNSRRGNAPAPTTPAASSSSSSSSYTGHNDSDSHNDNDNNSFPFSPMGLNI